MGLDKSTLVFAQRDQLSRSVEAMRGVCGDIFLSLRAKQETPARMPEGVTGVVVDQFGEKGPLGGILSAFQAYPGCSWLVLAIDLPFAGAAVLDHLVKARNPARPATAYRSVEGGLTEPMCAIYESSSGVLLRELFLHHNILSPRKILISLDVCLVDPPDAWALDNVNTPEECEVARKRIAGQI